MVDVKDNGAEATLKRVALVVASMAAFLTPFMVSSVNVALVSIDKEFQLNAVTLGWIPTAYLLAAAIFLVPFGRLADIHGLKKVFLYGIILYTVSCLLLPFSRTAGMLLAFRVVEGIASAAIFGTGAAMVASIFPVGERGKALGIVVASTYAGLSLGPPLGGLLIEHFTWRSIFFVNVPLGAIIIALVLLKLKGEWAEAKGEGFDRRGSVTYGLGLAALIYGLSLVPQAQGIGLVAGGIAALALFLRWEMKARNPVVRINLFRHNTVFIWSNVAALINYSATFAVGFLLSLYLQYIKGLSPASAGLILVAQPIVMAAVSPVAGRLSDRFEPRIVSSIGMGLTTAGLILLTFLQESTAVSYIMVSLVILGLGFGLFSSPNTNAVMSSVDRKFYGVASGTVGTMRLLGQMFSLAIAVLLFSLYLGTSQITPEYYGSFLKTLRPAFTIFASLCFGGVFASLARGRMRPKN